VSAQGGFKDEAKHEKNPPDLTLAGVDGEKPTEWQGSY